VGSPILYLVFNDVSYGKFKETFSVADIITMRQAVSSHGDMCHWDILGMTNSSGDKFFKFSYPDNLYQCDGNKSILLSADLPHAVLGKAKDSYESRIKR
jgi:hypothetical protein